jgi:hypothetical protein
LRQRDAVHAVVEVPAVGAGAVLVDDAVSHVADAFDAFLGHHEGLL